MANNRVYFHNSQPALLTLDATTGEELLRAIHPGQGGASDYRATISGDLVFAQGGYFGGIDAYNIDGSRHWFRELNQQDGWIPAADEANVYAYMGSGSAIPGPLVGTLFVMGQTSGSREATIAHPRSERALPDLQSVMLGGREDAFALTATDHSSQPNSRTLVCFDLSSESIRWELDGEFSGTPAVANGVIAIPEQDKLQFVDQASGERMWEWSEGYCSGNVILTENFAFVQSSSTFFQRGTGVNAIDLNTRESVWNSDGVLGWIALEDELLVISGGGGIWAYGVENDPPNSGSVTLRIEQADDQNISLVVLSETELIECIIERSLSLSQGSWEDIHDCLPGIVAGVPYTHSVGIQDAQPTKSFFRVRYAR